MIFHVLTRNIPDEIQRQSNLPKLPSSPQISQTPANSMTNSPSPGFAIAENPEHISKAHFKFDFSLASAASKRTHLLSVWGTLWLPSWAADTSPERLGSPWGAGSCPCPQFIPWLPSSAWCWDKPGTHPGQRDTCSQAGPRWNLTAGRPSFWIEKGMGFAGSYF